MFLRRYLLNFCLDKCIHFDIDIHTHMDSLFKGVHLKDNFRYT